jgi:hypothetical protein
MLALYALAAATATTAPASGTDPSPAGLQAVRDVLDVSANLCAAAFRQDPNLDVDAVLKPKGIIIPGQMTTRMSGDVELMDGVFKRPDGSLKAFVSFRGGIVRRCTVYTPLTVWNQMGPSMPAYIKATGLPLVQDKQYAFIWRGPGLKVSSTVGADGGTLMTIERQ